MTYMEVRTFSKNSMSKHRSLRGSETLIKASLLEATGMLILDTVSILAPAPEACVLCSYVAVVEILEISGEAPHSLSVLVVCLPCVSLSLNRVSKTEVVQTVSIGSGRGPKNPRAYTENR
jgi:hypothetical protein